jgi:hypothetical protein
VTLADLSAVGNLTPTPPKGGVAFLPIGCECSEAIEYEDEKAKVRENCRTAKWLSFLLVEYADNGYTEHPAVE